MKIKTFRLFQDKDKIPYMVKEKEVDYYEAFPDNLLCPNDAVKVLRAFFELDKLAEEHVYVIANDVNLQPVNVFELSHGDKSSTLLDPKSLFTRLLLSGSSRCIIAHNHPSGCLTPSKHDILAAKRLKKAGKILGIEIEDFIIINRDEYLAFSEGGFFDEE